MSTRLAGPSQNWFMYWLGGSKSLVGSSSRNHEPNEEWYKDLVRPSQNMYYLLGESKSKKSWSKQRMAQRFARSKSELNQTHNTWWVLVFPRLRHIIVNQTMVQSLGRSKSKTGRFADGFQRRLLHSSNHALLPGYSHLPASLHRNQSQYRTECAPLETWSLNDCEPHVENWSMEWLTFEPSTLCLDTVALNWVSGTPEVLASLVFLPKAAWHTVAKWVVAKVIATFTEIIGSKVSYVFLFWMTIPMAHPLEKLSTFGFGFC